MSKKGLLNEATVRRFMGLAGMESSLVSNTLKEMYQKDDAEKEKKMEETVDEMKYKREDEKEKTTSTYLLLYKKKEDPPNYTNANFVNLSLYISLSYHHVPYFFSQTLRSSHQDTSCVNTKYY